MVTPAERLTPPEHRIAYPNVTAGAALDGDHEFAADALVVGTGAGGATAAALLRDAGLDVLMLEEGALHRVETFVTDPATIFYNKFVSDVNKQAQRLEGFADEFAAILSRQIDQRG